MHANTRYQPRAPRSISFGAALAINGAIIAGLMFSVPDLLPKPQPKPFEGRNIPLPQPVPEDTPKPKPRPEKAVARTEPRPTIPDPIIPTSSESLIRGTTVIPDSRPIDTRPADPGPPVALDPPKPIVALIGASQDSRYLRDFQPEYPSQEIRAQRDGVVTLRVLIGADGRVKAVEPLSATSDAFFAVTKRQALGKWRFRPATRGGVAEESWKTMTVRFRLEDAR